MLCTSTSFLFFQRSIQKFQRSFIDKSNGKHGEPFVLIRFVVSVRRFLRFTGGQLSPHPFVISSINERSSIDETGDDGGGVSRLTIEYSMPVGVEEVVLLGGDERTRQGHWPEEEMSGWKTVKRIGTCEGVGLLLVDGRRDRSGSPSFSRRWLMS